MKARAYNNGKYRWGYNNQEEINEIKGTGNYLDFAFRGCDPRLGRFFAVDPLAREFAYNSPYAFAENRVIDGKELEGLEVLLIGNISSYGFVVSGSMETGIIFAPDGIYGYRTWGGSLGTSIGGSTGLSVTFYPNMPLATYAIGGGVGAAVGTGEGVLVSGGVVYSSGYYGVQGTMTVGGKISPFNGGVSGGYTYFTDLSGITPVARKEILEAGKAKLNSDLTQLIADNNKVAQENTGLIEKNASLTEKLKTARGENAVDLQEQINENKAEITENNVEMMENKSKKQTLESMIGNVDTMLTDLAKEEE